MTTLEITSLASLWTTSFTLIPLGFYRQMSGIRGRLTDTLFFSGIALVTLALFFTALIVHKYDV